MDALGQRPQDVEMDWNSGYDIYSSRYTVTELQRFLADHQELAKCEQNAIIPSFALTKEQLEFMQFMNVQIKKLREEQLLLILLGKAGAGKSSLISEVASLAQKNQIGYKLLSFTGSAAFSINGQTIHSAFRIGAFNASLEELLRSRPSKAFIDSFQDVELIVLDEFSMLDPRMLNFMSKRLQQAFNSPKPFAGRSVILSGDLGQLRCVGSCSLGTDPNLLVGGSAKEGLLLYQTFNRVHRLTINLRQAEDVKYQELLSRTRSKSLTREDVCLLSSRCSGRLTPEEKACFDDAVRIFALRRDVQFYNNARLAELGMPVVQIHHTIDGNRHPRVNNIFVGPGVRVMLRRNVNINTGLSNGNFGTIQHIVYGLHAVPGLDQPDVITVKFDKYRGETLFDGSVPLTKVSIPFYNLYTDDYRTVLEFPISLGYASTLHKIQGRTLSKAVVHLGDREIFPNQSYVGLSRVSKLDGIMFTGNRIDAGRFSRQAGFHIGLSTMLEEEARLSKFTIWGPILNENTGTNRTENEF